MTTATHDEAHASREITQIDLTPPWVVKQQMKQWGVLGGIGAVLAVAGYVLSSQVSGPDRFFALQHFFRAYLLGYMICFGLTLGSMALLMVQHITGGKWGLILRRFLEAGSRNIGILFLMFLPLMLGLKYLYPWMGAIPYDLGPHGTHAIEFRQPYMSEKYFFWRHMFFFLAWAVLIKILNNWSLKQDVQQESSEEANNLRLRFMRLSGGGILFYAITVSLAAVDFVMSLDPLWYSTIWGMLYMVGQTLHALSFSIIVLVLLAQYEPLKSLLRKSELHDNGKLLLAFVMLYTYLSFSQFIIIWSGNLTEEIPWYIARVRGGWMPIAAGLALFHFAVPFLLLLNRNLKKQPSRLAKVAALLVIARALDLLWHIYPNLGDQNVLIEFKSGMYGHLNLTWMDIAIPVGMFSIWVAMYFYQLGRRPMLPAYHHLVPEILEQPHGAH